MPRVYPPRRPHVGFRIDQDVLDAIDKLAAAKGVERSEVMRDLLRDGLPSTDRKQP